MSVVDIGLILEKLKELDRYLKQLERYKGITAAELEIDLDKSWIVERGLHLSIQILLDIGNHILAAEGITVERYADIFMGLAELQVFPLLFAEKIRGMAGFRNILVHEYARIDLNKLVEVLNTSLSDLREYARYIMVYINGNCGE
ncbi:MAG TPA: DUF86 domain-containing protein [Firmicutes bacterium]|nr:DUF86 domain-containing protein [Bacillota bacterium]HBR33562.1 DUF86 domain-containing protein [Bacillota bacterium]